MSSGVDIKIRLQGAQAVAARLQGMAKRAGPSLDLAIRQQAEIMRKDIITGIREQSPAGRPFKSLSRLTLALRKARGFTGTKALIRTGTYIRNIVVQQSGFASYFVGVLRTAPDSRGRDAADIAAITEYGRTIVVRVTPKMRRFLMAALREAGELGNRDSARGGIRQVKATDRVMVIRIPARPAITPVVEEAKRNPARVQAQLQQRIAKLIGYAG
jgi:hypothetical protein